MITKGGDFKLVRDNGVMVMMKKRLGKRSKHTNHSVKKESGGILTAFSVFASSSPNSPSGWLNRSI